MTLPEEPIIASTQANQNSARASLELGPCTGIVCYKCNSQKSRNACALFPMQWGQTHGSDCLGNDINEALPVIQTHVNEMPCLALLDSSYSCTIVSVELCCAGKKSSIRATTISGEMCMSWDGGSEDQCRHWEFHWCQSAGGAKP